jgi:hypothetical protein
VRPSRHFGRNLATRAPNALRWRGLLLPITGRNNVAHMHVVWSISHAPGILVAASAAMRSPAVRRMDANSGWANSGQDRIVPTPPLERTFV